MGDQSTSWSLRKKALMPLHSTTALYRCVFYYLHLKLYLHFYHLYPHWTHIILKLQLQTTVFFQKSFAIIFWDKYSFHETVDWFPKIKHSTCSKNLCTHDMDWIKFPFCNLAPPWCFLVYSCDTLTLPFTGIWFDERKLDPNGGAGGRKKGGRWTLKISQCCKKFSECEGENFPQPLKTRYFTLQVRFWKTEYNFFFIYKPFGNK